MWAFSQHLIDRVGVLSTATAHTFNIGFLINPKGTQSAQPWHVDYSYTNCTIFVPITKVDDDNMTQYLETDEVRVSDLDDGWAYPGT